MSSVAPACLQPILKGASEPADPENVTALEPPEWMDPELVAIGQKFALRNLAALSFSDLLSLIILLADPGGRKPLVYTNRSSTVFTAFKRYVSTANRVLSWYECDFFDPTSLGARNLQAVRRMHRAVRDGMKKSDPCFVEEKTTVADKMPCPLNARLREDLKGIALPLSKMDDEVWVNQLAMSITQFGFIGLMVLYPKKLGAVDATNEELEGLVHLWAVLGNLLGIKDEYNLCLGGLEKCAQKFKAVVDAWVIPALAHVVDDDWEHMTRCIVEGLRLTGPEMTYEASLLYLCWLLDLETPTMSAAIPMHHHIRFSVMRFAMTKAMWLPYHRRWSVWLLRRRQRRATEASEKWLQRAQKKAEAYPSTIKVRA